MQTTQHLHVRSLSMYPPPPSSLKRWRDTREQSTFSLQKIRQESSVEISGAFQNKSKWNEDFLSQYVTSTALGRSLSECTVLNSPPSLTVLSLLPSATPSLFFLQLHLHYTFPPPPLHLSLPHLSYSRLYDRSVAIEPRDPPPTDSTDSSIS